MQVEFKCDKLKPCRCGFQPDHYTVGYGRTPYDVFCPTCIKQSARAKCKVTGSSENVVDYWNKHVSKLTLEEMEKEVSDFQEEKKKETGYDGYKTYIYYWIKGKGEDLYASCR